MSRALDIELTKRDYELAEIITAIDEEIVNAPKESLRASTQRGKTQYYIRTKPSERSGKYVRKADLPRAAAIAQRDYDLALRAAALKEQASIKELLSIRESDLPEDVFGKLILPRQELAVPHFISDEEYAARWLAEPYTSKGFKEGDPEFHSTDGTRVRSKSEALLGDIFDSYPVPKKFECPVRLHNGKIIHPDYTLLNVRERKEYIWEHFGRADDQSYMEYNIGRLNDLIKSGFYHGINLILTFETKAKPLDVNIVRALIEKFLL